MDFFKTYHSNTLGGSGNQSYFLTDGESELCRGRVFYKIFAGGTYNYSFLFSNTTDSTFADGSHSVCNTPLPPWQIEEAYVGIVKECSPQSMCEPEEMLPLLFKGKSQKNVASGELFCSDPLKLSPKAGDSICLEVAFRGTKIPYHEESILPCFALVGDKWCPSKHAIFASMVGCDRPISHSIGFWGDSITQGIGTEAGTYTHWNAVVADLIGDKNSYWNLGLGCGRASDAASGGIWLSKAKENDTVIVCFGVNDILNHRSAEEIKADLTSIITSLHNAGVRVILQSVPPFDYTGEQLDIWHEVNDYLKNILSKEAELFFDCATLLGESDELPQKARFGGHPNGEGCLIWGKALAECIKSSGLI